MITVGLAGKPNAGKSTFFRAATRAEAEVGNYPFTTIDANRGVAAVRTECPCGELEGLDGYCGNCRDGRRYVPVELIDVAGLVPDAHEGRGLGNRFLDELRQADVILHVVDASGGTDEEGEPVEVGEHDPHEDVEFLEHEMEMWIAGVLSDNLNGLVRRSKTPEFELVEALADVLTGVGASDADVRRALRDVDLPPVGDWGDEHVEALAREVRALSKPILVVANKVDVAPDGNVESLVADGAVPASAESELALRRADESGMVDYAPGDGSFDVTGDISDEQRAGLERVREVVDRYGGTGVQKALDAAVYDLLDRITAYPVENENRWTDGSGNVLPDAFLLRNGATPRDLAYAIHSDIGDAYHHAVDGRTKQRVSDDTELEEGDVLKVVTA
ncbi:MAG: redox-regulated ATPase YchF [Halobacteria archaeon]